MNVTKVLFLSLHFLIDVLPCLNYITQRALVRDAHLLLTRRKSRKTKEISLEVNVNTRLS